MSLRFSPNFLVTNPATAGFSVSGAGSDAGNGATPDAGSNGGQDAGTGFGLAPPDREVQPTSAGTGLAPPGGNASPDSQPRYDLDYIQRVVQALGGDPQHFRFSDALGSTGTDGVRMIPVGGGARSAPPAEGDPFELSGNPRNAAAFDLLSNIDPNLDFTGTLAALRDTGDAVAYLNEMGTKNAIDALKESIGRTGLKVPSEGQLGALPGYVKNAAGVAVPVYDQADLLNRYRSALQMSILERQGTIELDHNDWTIKTIGKDHLTPEQFEEEIRNRYQKAFSDGVEDYRKRKEKGQPMFNRQMPEDLERGLWADLQARRTLGSFLKSIGVPEGPGQLVALSRWAYLPNDSGQYVQPDVLMDNGLLTRHVLDGKAGRFKELWPAMVKQLRGYYDLGAKTVEAVTPEGRILIPREAQGGRKGQVKR